MSTNSKYFTETDLRKGKNPYLVKNAFITGANRGIGFEVARQLGERGYSIILTGRREDAIHEAAKKLKEYPVLPVVLDMGDRQSIATIKDRLDIDRIDILIHNAAVLYEEDRGGSILRTYWDVIDDTMKINTLGPIYLTQVLQSYLREGSRIINISARPALFQYLGKSTAMSMYKISKAAFHAWSILLAKEMEQKGIIVANMHPGWVKTDMGGPDAIRSVKEGVDTIVWLAEEAPASVHGKFFMDRKEIPWY